MHQDQPSELTPLDEPGDAELISAVRGGDLDAYGTLFARHVDSARRLARQLVSAGDVDDLVSDAFAKVLSVLQRGGGPDLAFRAYLLTSLRRLHVDKLRSGSRLTTTDDLAPYDPGVAFEDTAVAGFDNAAAAKAFASLPERWQQVLWHTEVEGQKPAEIAPLLGISANSVSALAYRAREGLRQAFISMHAQDATEDDCAATRANLGAYLRGGISRRDGAKVEDHLSSCRECSAIYLELAEVNNDLGAVLAPMLLGGAGVGYLAAAHVGAVAAAKGGVLLFLDRAKDWVLHNPVGRVAAGTTGVAAAAAVVAAAALAHGGGGAPSAGQPPASVAPTSSAAPTSPAPPSSEPTRKPTQPPAKAPVTPARAPLSTPTSVPSPATPSPTSTPTTTPSSKPQIRQPLAPVTASSAGAPVTIDLTRGAVDPNGDPITVLSAKVTRPSHGTVVINGAVSPRLAGRTLTDIVADRTVTPRAAHTTITYTPDPGWRGTDTISYVLTDGHGGRVSGTVEVRTPNAVPIAVDDVAQATVGWLTATPITINVLGNDSDANHDPLTIIAVTRPAYGSATIVGGAIRYTPPIGLGTRTDSFRYTISDGHGGTATATVVVHLGALPDRPPTAQSFAQEVAYGTPTAIDLAAHATDPDGDPLSFTVTGPAAHGTVVIDPSGVATYQPDLGYSGPDAFDYTVSDGRGGTASGTVSITVTARPNAAPTAGAISQDVAYGTLATIDLSAHAADPDGDPLSFTLGSAPAHGTVTVGAGGSATYTPDLGYSGPDAFDYTVSDGRGGTATGTVSLTVAPLASDLRLTSAATAVVGYEHVRLSAAGIPAGYTATFHIVITGITGWAAGQSHSLVAAPDCTLPSAPSGTLDLTCTVSGNGELLHFDFNVADPWTVDASLTPNGFVDSVPGDTTFHRETGDALGS